MSRAALLIVVLGLAALDPAAGQVISESPTKKTELDRIENELRRRAEEQRRLTDEAETRQKEIEALRRRMIETANSVQSSERRIAEISAELARLDSEETTIGASLLEERRNLGDVLAALQSLELSRPPALLISPDDANEAARAAMLLSSAAPEIEARAKALRTKLDRLAAIRKARDRERALFGRTNEEIAQRRAVLAELLAKKQRERDVAARLAAAAQQETAALAARATTLRDVIDRLDRLATAITPRLKPPPPKITPGESLPLAATRPASRPRVVFAPGTPFATARGALSPPVVGAIAGRFGAQKPEGGVFEGVRFAVRDKAIVTAPHEASVAFARAWGPLGNLVILDVGSGYYLLLIGVSNLLVQEGQKVGAGEPIGSIAAAAGKDATLDFEIRRNSEPVNPSLWLAGQTSG